MRGGDGKSAQKVDVGGAAAQVAVSCGVEQRRIGSCHPAEGAAVDLAGTEEHDALVELCSEAGGDGVGAVAWGVGLWSEGRGWGFVKLGEVCTFLEK